MAKKTKVQRSDDDVVICGAGAYYPETVLEVPALVDDEYPKLLYKRLILASLGVDRVRAAAPEESATSLALEACQAALTSARTKAKAVEAICTVGCVLPDRDVWSSAAHLALELGAEQAECFGVGDAACAGAYAAFRVLLPVMRDPDGPNKVLLSCACLTPGRRFFPPATVFGDGAGAVVLGRRGKAKTIRPVVRADLHLTPRYLHTYGPSAGMARLRAEGRLEREAWTFQIHDRAAYAALSAENYDLGAAALSTTLARVGWSPDSVGRVLPDNVTLAVGTEVATRVDIPAERVDTARIPEHGHAFAADLLLNLSHSLAERRIEKGERVVALGMGLGQYWAVLCLEGS